MIAQQRLGPWSRSDRADRRSSGWKTRFPKPTKPLNVSHQVQAPPQHGIVVRLACVTGNGACLGSAIDR